MDVGTPAELIHRHCPERAVIVATADASARGIAAHSRSRQRRRADDSVTVRGRGDLVTNVIRCIAEHRVAVADFRTETPTLEDVFLRLTGHSIRS